MNEDGYWIERVLTKIYDLYLNGGLKYEISPWSCDWHNERSLDINLENCKMEIAALEKLSNIGVIQIELLSNIYKDDPNNMGRLKAEVRHLEWLPHLTGFKYEKFAEYCRLIGFIPRLSARKLPRVEVDLGNGFRVHDRNIISYKNDEIKLAPQKAKVIACIMRNSKLGHYTTNDMLIGEVYRNGDSENPEAEIRRVISEARDVLQSATGDDSNNFIYNKRNIGYIFKAE